MKIKHSHRGTGKANKVPRSATFNPKAGPVPANQTYGPASKKKR